MFGDRIDYDRVRVVDGCYLPGQQHRWIMAPDGNIYWPGECGELAQHGEAAVRDTFIHEMTHVWQHQTGQSVRLRGFFLHAARILSLGFYDPYAWRSSTGRPFASYNLEQQAELAVEIYHGRRENDIPDIGPGRMPPGTCS